MQVMFFYGPDPTTVFDEISLWLDQFGEARKIEIHHIKQTVLPPNAMTVNTNSMHHHDAIERESDLIVSIWYDEIQKGN